MKEVIDFNAEYILENQLVLLRPLLQSDFENLLRFSAREPELWKYSLVTAAGHDNLRNYLAIAQKGRNEQKEYPFIVFDKRTKQYAGSTRFYDIQQDYQTLQLGYTWYGKEFHGTGLNKNCKYLLLEFAFEKLHMERVEFRADNENARSIAAMKSIGCKVDGILRSNMPKREGGRRDSIVLSILKDEWENDVKEMLRRKIEAF
ncbi:GNAT family N-acetyltransferase [Segetibacter koreensis]|uniref:GNAT family N-acetyltransferase n=1 Tax=Segetibacter koreensis TaxID=398037 RepID=UPI000364A79E|nr:GNAT family protein [Segetibacter koreensis]